MMKVSRNAHPCHQVTRPAMANHTQINMRSPNIPLTVGEKVNLCGSSFESSGFDKSDSRVRPFWQAPQHWEDNKFPNSLYILSFIVLPNLWDGMDMGMYSPFTRPEGYELRLGLVVNSFVSPSTYSTKNRYLSSKAKKALRK